MAIGDKFDPMRSIHELIYSYLGGLRRDDLEYKSMTTPDPDHPWTEERIYTIHHKPSGRAINVNIGDRMPACTARELIDAAIEEVSISLNHKPQHGASWGKNCPVPDRSRNSWDRRRGGETDPVKLKDLMEGCGRRPDSVNWAWDRCVRFEWNDEQHRYEIQ